MKVPELRTGEFTLVVKHDSPLALKGSQCVYNQDNEVVGIFFGPYAGHLAHFCTTFTEAVKLALMANQQLPETPTVVENPTIVSNESAVTPSA